MSRHIQEFLETRIYREWGQPRRALDCLTSVLDKSAMSAAMVGIFRHDRDGVSDEDMRRRTATPHLPRGADRQSDRSQKQQSGELRRYAGWHTARTRLVDATGPIVHINSAGHALLNRACVLQASGGRLIVSDREADQISADIFTMAGDGDAANGVKGIAVPLTATSRAHCVAHVLS
jgi:hypothetical protein